MTTQVDLEKIRQMLETEREELLGKLRPDELEPEDRSENPGRGDLASTYTNLDRDVALRGVEEQTLEQIDAALARMEAGNYGICDDCGQPINPARMEALPYATFCIECQAKADRHS